MSEDIWLPIFLIVLGVWWTIAGWAAWTGRYRGWARYGYGYRVLLGVPGGIGIACLGLVFLLDFEGRLTVVLFLVAMILGAITLLMTVVTVFVKDRWYPRWYHDEPGHRW